MIYIHGGSFIFSYGSGNPFFKANEFARKNVITVAFNYRLGLFGFLASQSLKGNYGLQDQSLLMKWVARNIKSFGGNPDKVTLAGQSAGAMSIGLHLISKETMNAKKPLFHQVIMESNPLSYSYLNRSEWSTMASYVYKGLGCAVGDNACLRSVPASSILALYGTIPSVNLLDSLIDFPPLVEKGDLFPQQPYIGLVTGKYAKDVKILAGFNEYEGTSFIYGRFDALDQLTYNYAIQSLFGASAAAIIGYNYPWTPSVSDGRVLLSEQLTDVGFACPLLQALQGAAASKGSAKIYVYEYTHTNQNNATYPGTEACNQIACHASETPYVFETLNVAGYTPTAEEAKLSNGMNNAWGNFVRNGNPNEISTAESYPIYTVKYPVVPDSETVKLVTLDTVPNSVHTVYSRTAQCGLWALSGLYPSST